MTQHDKELAGPDLSTEGAPVDQLGEGATLLGHVDQEPVLLLRKRDEIYAIGATCTHYGGPLAEGLFDGERIHCPWHHACFDVRTGAAAAPALDPVRRYRVSVRDGRVFARDGAIAQPRPFPIDNPPESVVIVGAGAAGAAAAEMLRREGYDGPVTLVGRDESDPVDRPNLSKDFLAGTAPEEWVSLRPPGAFRAMGVELRLGEAALSIDTDKRELRVDSGARLRYGALLLATGADPIQLEVPGAELPHVHTLRTLADSRAIIRATDGATEAVVVGASFIGLEVAASLRARGVGVTVVAPEAHPLERVLGRELSGMLRLLHERHGVRFHLEQKVASIASDAVTLTDGTRLPAQLVVTGIGVRPATALAESANLEIDHGIVTDRFLRTSNPRIWAAGDAACWPEPHTGERVRVEHWVVAQRLGQCAARNMLGREQPFDDVPFFWTAHYGTVVTYVGHTNGWDQTIVQGSPADGDCTVAFKKGGRVRAVAAINRDLDSLKAELALGRGVEP